MKPNCDLLLCTLLFVVLAVANGAGSIPGRDGCSLRINEFDTGLFARTPPSQPFFVELAQENCKTENLLDDVIFVVVGTTNYDADQEPTVLYFARFQRASWPEGSKYYVFSYGPTIESIERRYTDNAALFHWKQTQNNSLEFNYPLKNAYQSPGCVPRIPHNTIFGMFLLNVPGSQDKPRSAVWKIACEMGRIWYANNGRQQVSVLSTTLSSRKRKVLVDHILDGVMFYQVKEERGDEEHLRDIFKDAQKSVSALVIETVDDEGSWQRCPPESCDPVILPHRNARIKDPSRHFAFNFRRAPRTPNAENMCSDEENAEDVYVFVKDKEDVEEVAEFEEPIDIGSVEPEDVEEKEEIVEPVMTTASACASQMSDSQYNKIMANKGAGID